MFTGIVTELARVSHIERSDHDDITTITVTAPGTVRDLAIGDSVAVNGVCLTAIQITESGFSVQAVPETLSRSNLGSLRPGAAVNLERPMSASSRFDGHIVQGHVDGVGTILSMTQDGGSILVRCTLPTALAPYVVEKGSVTIDGTSLTVTEVTPPGTPDAWFGVALIPHTLSVTTFGSRSVGDVVNLEVDVIAKYVERMMGGPS
jgi:riboflavin synthase